MVGAVGKAFRNVALDFLQPPEVGVGRYQVDVGPPRVLLQPCVTGHRQRFLELLAPTIVTGHKPGGANVVGSVRKYLGIAEAPGQLDRTPSPLDRALDVQAQHPELSLVTEGP